MNKDKLIEAKKVVMHEIGQALEKTTKKEINFNIQMAIAGVLGDLTATLDDKLDDIIQSEPEEKKPIERINEEDVTVGAVVFRAGVKVQYCPECKKPISNDLYCRYCGQKLDRRTGELHEYS